MDFLYDDEQDALREAVRGLVGKAYSDYENRRQAVEGRPGFDEKQWAKMAEMGLLGLPFAEDDGGVGAGPVEIGIVCQELGRVIAPEPYLTSVVLAGGLVSACGTTEQRQEILGALCGRRERAGLRPRRARPRLDPDRREGHRDPGRRRLDADRRQGAGAARRPRRRARGQRRAARRRHRPVPGRRASAPSAPATRRTTARRAARVSFDGTAATPLGEPGLDVTASISTVQDITRVMAANQALGAMQFLLPTTTEYLRSRKQFGVPLARSRR